MNIEKEILKRTDSYKEGEKFIYSVPKDILSIPTNKSNSFHKVSSAKFYSPWPACPGVERRINNYLLKVEYTGIYYPIKLFYIKKYNEFKWKVWDWVGELEIATLHSPKFAECTSFNANLRHEIKLDFEWYRKILLREKQTAKKIENKNLAENLGISLKEVRKIKSDNENKKFAAEKTIAWVEIDQEVRRVKEFLDNLVLDSAGKYEMTKKEFKEKRSQMQGLATLLFRLTKYYKK